MSIHRLFKRALHPQTIGFALFALAAGVFELGFAPPTEAYIVVGANDLGMHCMQTTSRR